VLDRNEDNTKLNLNELTEQCELFFDEHANSFPSDDFRNAFAISLSANFMDQLKNGDYLSRLMEHLILSPMRNLRGYC